MTHFLEQGVRSTRGVHCGLTGHRGYARARRRLRAPQKDNRVTVCVSCVVSSQCRELSSGALEAAATGCAQCVRILYTAHVVVYICQHAMWQISFARPRRIVSTSGRTELDTDLSASDVSRRREIPVRTSRALVARLARFPCQVRHLQITKLEHSNQMCEEPYKVNT